MSLSPFMLCLLLRLAPLGFQQAAEEPTKQLPLPGQVLTVAGHTAFVIEPPVEARTPGPLPWVWYAPTLRGLPSAAEVWMFQRFLAAGVAIAGIDVGESYGSPKGCAGFQALYETLTTERGYGQRPVLLARSRGGLMLYSWAADHPECVAGIAGIYPVCNLISYPGLVRAAPAFEMTPQQLQQKLAEHNPIDRLAALAKAKVPILHLHGDRDGTVPLEANSAELGKRYAALGGPVEIEVVEGQGHNMWDGWFQSAKLTEFVIARALGKAPGAGAGSEEEGAGADGDGPMPGEAQVEASAARRARDERPSVLLIAVDDLNDWVGCLGGHPQAHTPNIDALAARGVLFANAHCQSPVCNPSRASLATSRYPASTGIYFLNPPIEASPVARRGPVLTERFEAEGYHVSGAGKLYHDAENRQYTAHYAGNFGGFGPRPKSKLSPFPGHPLWDWGAFPGNEGERPAAGDAGDRPVAVSDADARMPDARIAAWGAAQLSQDGPQPFFQFTGFYRPHVPQFAPRKWFELHPLDQVMLPRVVADDLDDLPRYGVDLTRLQHVAPTHEWVRQSGEWPALVQSYLACVSFVDAQVGKVLAALDASAHRDNTYVVLFSDHGFHLGEKERWAKRSLWEDSTRVPLIVAGPGIEAGQVCARPVQLLDIYPTLLALTGLAADSAHEGHSLLPLLQEPKAEWPYFARTSFGPGNVALRSERFRYIRYHDGSEEFYDHEVDEHEWSNRIHDPAYAVEVARHRAAAPATWHPALGQGSTGHKAYAAAEAGR